MFACSVRILLGSKLITIFKSLLENNMTFKKFLDLKICGYNGSSPVVEPLSQEASVLIPDAGGGCLEDAPRIPPPLEDPLEPFESLDRGKGVEVPVQISALNSLNLSTLVSPSVIW